MEEVLDDFAQFSWVALVEEARRRGVPILDGMDRDALLDAIRAHPRAKGPLSRARSLIGRVVDTVRSALPGSERRSERPPVALPREAPPPLPFIPRDGIHVIDEGPEMAIVWRIHESQLVRARLLIGPGAELRVRTIRISWPEHASEPMTEQSDHHAAGHDGVLRVPARKQGEKIVAAIGLSDSPGDFTAIAHTTHG